MNGKAYERNPTMHNINKLLVYQIARQNLRAVAKIIRRCPAIGDLRNQIERAAISVVSNIAEGAGSNTDANFARFLGYAQGSNRELLAQLEMLNDFGGNCEQSVLNEVDRLSGMLYKLIQRFL